MIEVDDFKMLGISLCIGLLIGLERGWHTRDREEGMRVAGLRTYGLISLLGGCCAILAQQIESFMISVGFIALSGILLVAYYKSLTKFEDFSITGIIAGLLSFVLGAMTIFDNAPLAAAVAVIITALLGFKPLLHSWLNKMEQAEFDATLKLLLISVVMLPILPNQGYGPWGVLNPYYIWSMVVLIAGISYLGYFAIKIVGNRRGTILTGAFGGLVSSTAVTLSLSRLTSHHTNIENMLAAGILTACGTMFARTLLLVFILSPFLFVVLLKPLLAMALVTYLLAFVFWHYSQDMQKWEEVVLRNPFELGIALKFGIFLVVIMLLSKLLTEYFGNLGTYFLAAAGGLADVDPITLSMAQMCKTGLNTNVYAVAILIAVSINSIVKSAYAWGVGGRVLGQKVALSLFAALSVGFFSNIEGVSHQAYFFKKIIVLS